MNTKPPFEIFGVYLRVAISVSYLWEVADRLGILGAHGQPHVGWGDWSHFIKYAQETMSFLPVGWVPLLAVMATAGEGIFGLMLFFGIFTRIGAIGSGILSLCFGIAMALSFGIESPLGYSVFTLSAASFLLAVQPRYIWSFDTWLQRKNIILR